MTMKYSSVFRIFLSGILLAFLASSCVKEGPMGLPGADGKDGINGINGTNGKDGNVTCLECHNLTNWNAVTDQYKTSLHAAGPTTVRSSSNQCAPCHSHEGFVEMLLTKKDTTYAGFSRPTVMNCETCHSSHKSFDFVSDGPDYALRTVGAVNLMLYTDPTKVIDYGNNSNLCVNCHQPRNSYPVPGSSGETTITIANNRYGPHHGAQGTILEGIGCWEYPGSTPYPGTKSSTHRNAGACIMCHMDDYENQKGGHTWKVTLASCKSCHSSATTFDVNGIQTEVTQLMAQLKTALQSKGALNTAGSPVAGTYPLAVAGSVWNYVTIVEDQSNGVHNPDYTIAVLKNSIQALQ
jgi:hypothetical protein